MSKHHLRKDQYGYSDELMAALAVEKSLTARWYERVSGSVPWGIGERERLDSTINAQNKIVDRMIQQHNADQFAALPDC
jgi:hypothetical protein